MGLQHKLRLGIFYWSCDTEYTASYMRRNKNQHPSHRCHQKNVTLNMGLQHKLRLGIFYWLCDTEYSALYMRRNKKTLSAAVTFTLVFPVNQ